MKDFYTQAKELFTYSQSMRRDFHMHPELGFQEVRTAGIVAKELQNLGLEVTTGIGKTGVVAMIEGSQPGPTLLLRADMDALPIIEKTGAEYASKNPGVMHACGHDGHTAILLTVAKMLNNARDQFPGSIKLVFQPAEEGQGGAESMIADGVFDNPKVDVTFGLHLWNEKPVGWLGIAEGPTMAGAEKFDITVTGKGGHGAMPQGAIDPILASAQIVNALQSIVSRNVAPLESAVVSVTQFHGGDAFNVIPQTVELGGTLRTFDPKVRELVLKRVSEITTGISEALGCQAEFRNTRLTPAVINDSATIKLVQKAARQVLPDLTLDDSAPITMGSEDFAFMMEKVPGCFIFVGSANAERGLDYGHHHPKFDVDEQALSQAAALMAQSAIEILNSKKI
jgi:amidohydrolase